MTVKEMIEELQKLPPSHVVTMDTGDLNLSYASKVYQGSVWNVVISSDED